MFDVPVVTVPEPAAMAAMAGTVILTAFAVEFWFRGLVHGTMILDGPVQFPGGRWFLSRSAQVSTVVYALVTLLATAPWMLVSPIDVVDPRGEIAAVLGASLVGGLALAIMRERSLSIWPGFVAQALGGFASVGFWFWLSA